MDKRVESIEKLGFKKVGAWEWDEGKKKIKFILFYEKEKGGGGWVYAFVAGGEVKYIGETDREDGTLKGRMEDHQNKRGNGNPKRINEEITKVFENGKKVIEVFIYAIPLDEIKTKVINIGGEEIVLTASAFEKIAIGAINPDWNIDGKGGTK
jgi:hypothetical protein